MSDKKNPPMTPPPSDEEIVFGDELPVLPIRNAVLFPGAVSPFAFMVLLGYLARPIYSKEAEDGFYFSDLWDEFFAGLMPPTILISFALGSILLGFATPAEAAAIKIDELEGRGANGIEAPPLKNSLRLPGKKGIMKNNSGKCLTKFPQLCVIRKRGKKFP